MLTQTTEYALRAIAHLAATPEEWKEVRQISESLKIPANYLSKILGQLSKLGLLESRKGWGGGFRLKGDPTGISLEQVVRPFERLDHPRSCVFGLDQCSDENPCPLHDYWKQIVEIHEQMLRHRTVADLVMDRKQNRGAKTQEREG